MRFPIYTIGYGNRKIDTFIDLLLKYQVDTLADVRSRPFSRFQPDFKKEKLKAHLAGKGIDYVFLGNELGGRPENEACYTRGKVDYQKVKEQPFYKAGIGQLVKLYDSGKVMALMCAELDPNRCHRKLLLGDSLRNMGFRLSHIDKNGLIEAEELNLFGGVE